MNDGTRLMALVIELVAVVGAIVFAVLQSR